MRSHTPDRPPLPLYLTEAWRATADYGLYLATHPLLRALPSGDGHPVLVLPGLLADDASTRVLRRELRRLGYRAHGWQLGRNIGPTPLAVNGLRDRLDQLAHRHDRPVTLVGWSLGGIFARDLARRTPAHVRQVITLGSPFRMVHTNQSRAHRAFERYSHLHVERLALPLEGDRGPLPMPSTSVYSRYDGIVHWQACLEAPGPQTENIAVHASHLGLGHHPAVLYAVADRLAQAEGTWRPFRAPLPLGRLFPAPDQPGADELAGTGTVA
ncbi:alpha/beta hydrolase [Modestobacter sp. VKM Ac-2979]|uniref:alpha/beta hydrolase n=1 Tax=unclassified Modestobacter TaxID=2643866 RepID=UPI0022ABAC6A|nr:MULTISPECIES: alpha/beta hydrolase [unclassified Modestobacter]MCZ2811760.1 alpha/beta hydrolase [Modestobacter sp. VKM Ac-2979]MCZ2843483.1 alpha/beta hydrolase [Modestobacter sp. VKM Ac-2980]